MKLPQRLNQAARRALIPAALFVPVIVWRLTREEAYLAANLAGYGDYRGRVRYRLAPLLW